MVLFTLWPAMFLSPCSHFLCKHQKSDSWIASKSTNPRIKSLPAVASPTYVLFHKNPYTRCERQTSCGDKSTLWVNAVYSAIETVSLLQSIVFHLPSYNPKRQDFVPLSRTPSKSTSIMWITRNAPWRAKWQLKHLLIALMSRWKDIWRAW